MKMKKSVLLAAMLVLVNQSFLSMGLADPKPLAGAAPKISEAVFQLSEQAKKEELIEMKNLGAVQEISKLVPIEPALGWEMRPDVIDAQ